MTPIDELIALEAIRKLKARYYRLMDTKDWDGFELVFTEGATLDTSVDRPDVGAVVGRARIREYVEREAGPMVTIHQGHMPEIELTSPTTATGIWAVHDVVKLPEGSPLGLREFEGWGYYHDTYDKVDGQWLISSSRTSKLRRKIER